MSEAPDTITRAEAAALVRQAADTVVAVSLAELRKVEAAAQSAVSKAYHDGLTQGARTAITDPGVRAAIVEEETRALPSSIGGRPRR